MFTTANSDFTTEESLFSIRQNRMKPISRQRHPHFHFREIDRLMAPLRSPHPSPHHLSPHYKEGGLSDLQIKKNTSILFSKSSAVISDKFDIQMKNKNKDGPIDYLGRFDIFSKSDEDILHDLGDFSINLAHV